MPNTQHHPRERIYQAYWQDGSLDLFSGLAVAGIGVLWLADLVALGALAPLAAIALWAAFRRRVVSPRLGEFVFDGKLRSRMGRGQAWALIAGIAALVLALLVILPHAGRQAQTPWSKAIAPAIPAGLIALAGMLSAILFRIPRLFLYGGVAALCGALAAFFDLEPGWAILGAGLLTAAAGGILLGRFLRQFPTLPEEME